MASEFIQQFAKLAQHHTNIGSTSRVHLLCSLTGTFSIWDTGLGKSEIAVSNPALAFKFQRNKMFLPCSLVNIQYCGERDREIANSPPDRQGWNFESCLWRAVSSHSSHHPQEVLLAQFSLYVHICGLKHHSYHCMDNRAIDSLILK